MLIEFVIKFKLHISSQMSEAQQIIATEAKVEAVSEPKKSEGAPKERREQQRKRRNPKEATEGKPAERKEPREPRKPHEDLPNTTNVLLVGRRPAMYYLNLAKSLINLKKHEEIQLHGISSLGNAKVAQAASTLVKWGYVTLTRISTSHAAGSSLKATIKRADNFQQIFDNFEVTRVARREKYQKE